MRTVVLGERPPGLESFLTRRRALGQDRFDEVWEGSYHVAPPGPHPYHGIVDNELGVVLDPYARRRGLPTAAVVVEILWPDDESFEKFPFSAAHGVQEVLVAHPSERWVRCYDLRQDPPLEVEHSECLEVSMATFEVEIAWPVE